MFIISKLLLINRVIQRNMSQKDISVDAGATVAKDGLIDKTQVANK